MHKSFKRCISLESQLSAFSFRRHVDTCIKEALSCAVRMENEQMVIGILTNSHNNKKIKTLSDTMELVEHAIYSAAVEENSAILQTILKWNQVKAIYCCYLRPPFINLILFRTIKQRSLPTKARPMQALKGPRSIRHRCCMPPNTTITRESRFFSGMDIVWKELTGVWTL